MFEEIKDFFRSLRDVNNDSNRISMSSLSEKDWDGISDKDKRELLSESPKRITNILEILKGKTREVKEKLVKPTKTREKTQPMQSKNREQQGLERV